MAILELTCTEIFLVPPHAFDIGEQKANRDTGSFKNRRKCLFVIDIPISNRYKNWLCFFALLSPILWRVSDRGSASLAMSSIKHTRRNREKNLKLGGRSRQPEKAHSVVKTDISHHAPGEILILWQQTSLNFVSQQIAKDTAKIFVPWE